MRDLSSGFVLNVSDKSAIEADLHQELEAAKTVYESVSKRYRRAVQRCEQLGVKPPGPDGNGDLPPTLELSISQAITAQREAFKQYRGTLKRFNNFILYGELPARK